MVPGVLPEKQGYHSNAPYMYSLSLFHIHKLTQSTSYEQAEQLYTQTFMWSGDVTASLDNACTTSSVVAIIFNSTQTISSLYSTGHRQRQNETCLLLLQMHLLLSANVGVVFSLSLETRRKSPLVPCSVYSWIIHAQGR